MSTTTLPGVVTSIPDSQLGFDTSTTVSETVAKQFYEDGYRFCVRYVARTEASKVSHDISNAEALNILNAGLGLMIVQHVEGKPAGADGWTPSESLGAEYGTNAALFAQEVGLPAGVNLWLDLEGVNTATSAQVVIDYCQAWYNEVIKAGYVPGLYVGYNPILSGSQLYNDLSFAHYWQSGSAVPDQIRGYQLVQYDLDQMVNGIGIDKDKSQSDKLGGQALMLSLAAVS
jgi:hypothetical protein